MFRPFDHRLGHYLLLLIAWALLCLPNLGLPSLWDIDEGNNTEAASEMDESGSYIVPTFNYRLRQDKPPLLYWLQIAAFHTVGRNEWAARLPSALAALLALLATYELGRSLFGGRAGLYSAIILDSAVLFSAAAHFANPDALLNACTVLTLLLFWLAYRSGGRWWFAACGVTTGLAMLAKGPVGVVLPAAITTLFLLWQRQPRRLLDWRYGFGVLTFLLVAGPWYAWVGVETKGDWLRGFFLDHNLLRFARTMENHSGSPFFYYILILLLGFAPWSVFFALSVWNAVNEWRTSPIPSSRHPVIPSSRHPVIPSSRHPVSQANDMRPAFRFLLCWFAVYFLSFSASNTKLPNYILPLYPAVALVIARFLDRWRRGDWQPPAWALNGSLALLVPIGLGVSAGLLIGSGAIEIKALRGRYLPGLEELVWLGGLPILGMLVAFWYLRRTRRSAVISVLATTALLFTSGVFVFGAPAVDQSKAPRVLAAALPADQTRREVRIASYDYFQPSFVFYCRREVKPLVSEEQVREFLRLTQACYIVMPVQQWEEMRGRLPLTTHELARHYDLYDGKEIVLIANGAALCGETSQVFGVGQYTRDVSRWRGGFGNRVNRLDACQDFQKLAPWHCAGAILNAGYTHFFHPGTDGSASLLQSRSRMSTALPRQFDLGLGRCFVELAGYGDHPHFTVGSDVGIGRHDHGRTALTIAALWVEQFHPNNPAAAEGRHKSLLSERLALFRIV